MRAGKPVILSALISYLWATTAWSALMGQTRVYEWQVGAYSSDTNGLFSHCTASADYDSGISLVFAIGRNYSWSMGLMNPAWKLSLGDKFPVQYQVDNEPIISAAADVRGSNLVGIDLIDSAKLFNLFKLGRTLKIKAGEKIFRFGLNNSSKALDAAAMCTNAKIAAENGGGPDPFGNTRNAAQNSPQNDAAKVEAAAVTANLLSAANVQNFQVADTIPPGLEFFHSVWNAPGIMRTMRIDPRRLAVSL